tara:strand:+ start:594 stop:1049 length:456 start_codon:yes stop_codon:yes gene_type:complete
MGVTVRNTSRKQPEHDYLKYWSVVKYWAKRKYDVTTADIEMMMFLYSEHLFNKTKFEEYQEIMSWDKNRFYKLIKQGWIHKWRNKKGKEAALYELTYKGKRMVSNIYGKLNGEEFPENYVNNPVFKHDVKFRDKVFRNQMKKINKEIRKDR